MKKILCLAIALIMCACVFASCAQNKDKLIVGYTLYEPMNYEKDGELIKGDGDGAYEIISIQPYDMFPQTKHVETLVQLKRKE